MTSSLGMFPRDEKLIANLTSLENLSENTSNIQIPTDGKGKTNKHKHKPKPKKEEVAESWEDELSSSGSTTETEGEEQPRPLTESSSVQLPTRSSPIVDSFPYSNPTIPTVSSGGVFSSTTTRVTRPQSDDKRPEKSAAAASRLIAGALGVRVPKMTQEQREYEKVVREKERRRREEEKEKAKEEERKIAAIWED